MMRCKQVADALAEQRYDRMPPMRRALLRMHIALCFVCGGFHKDVIQMQRSVDELKRREEDQPPPPDECLSQDARARLEAAIRSAKTGAPKAE